ncbi:MAG: neutral/alkaline non-lysosomal ceramidase N-terminal domain-containing protein [Acidobacteria bacterium]|nr:neutral/alkaline non-lysosomal ceramidase N-terminal domain-containing protein [Acidobacteriota bacterium]
MKRHRFSASHLACFILLLAAGYSAPAETMKAGVAKVDITPPLGYHMWGYFDRVQGAQGILDPLFARVLVLEAGEQRIAYVDLDLGRTFGPTSLANLQKAVKANSGIGGLIVQATHTHAGPVILDEYPKGTPAWETEALRKIADAVRDAAHNVVPVRLGVGYGEAFIGYNRRRVESDGSVTMIWQNPQRIPTWPVDATIALLRIDRLNGEPLAILANYATHPVIFGNDNLRFSADFPGVMCKVVEQAFDGKPLAFFVQGGAGDINVYDATTPITQDAVSRRDWSGETLGKAVVAAAKQIQTADEANASIDFTEETVAFPLRWNADKFREAVLQEISPQAFDLFSPPIQATMQLPVTTALLNKKIAIMGMPGEPFLQFQRTWRSECPAQSCFFLGYTNGYYGYFPTIRAASEGGYGATSATTWVEVGAGEQIVNHALIDTEKMLGHLHDAPGAQWKDLR